MSDTLGPDLAPLHDKGDLQNVYGQCCACTGPMPISIQCAMCTELLNSGRMPETQWLSTLGGQQRRAGAS